MAGFFFFYVYLACTLMFYLKKFPERDASSPPPSLAHHLKAKRIQRAGSARKTSGH